MRLGSTALAGLPFLAILTLSLLLPALASDLSTPEAKAASLLHCLGEHESAHADRVKVSALIQANPNPADDNVWSQLSPLKWGFEGHDVPGGDTWNPDAGAAQTAKDQVTRQHQKLIRCAKKLQLDDIAPPNKGSTHHLMVYIEAMIGAHDLGNGWGSHGFRQIRQPVTALNDAQINTPGAADTVGALAQPQLSDQQEAGSATPSNPAGQPPGQPADRKPDQQSGSQPGLQPGQQPGQQATEQAGVADADVLGKQKTNPDGTVSAESASDKLAPGLGPKSPSVAPAFEKDPGEQNMPKTLSDTAGVDAGGQTSAKPDANTGVAPVAAEFAVDGADPAAGPTDPTQNTLATQDRLVTLGTNSSSKATTQAMLLAGQSNNLTNATTSPGLQDSKLVQTTPLQTDGIGSDLFAQNSAQLNSAPGCRQIRVRKEYSTLTRAEKKAFVDAVKCVRKKPSRYQTDPGWNAADDWTLLHIRMVKYVHFTAYFTPFHRGFLAIVERDLNECGFHGGLPWVDWTKTSQDPSINAVFDSDATYGLGTDGHGDNKNCPWQTGLAVTDGALSDHFFNAPFRHRLCRRFNNMDVNSPNPHFGSNCTTFINPAFVKGLGTTHDNGRFFDFSSSLEISMHLAMHTCIGGNLAWLSSSPNDMVFHLHHGCADNIFSSWQKKSPRNARAFNGPKKQQKGGQHPPWTARAMDTINYQPLAPNVVVSDLLDHTSGRWGGRMCYRYDYDIAM